MTKKKFTVLGKAQARPGYIFTFSGIPHSCLHCQYKKACLENLEEDRLYTVRTVLDKRLFCTLRDKNCILVEVEETEVTIILKAEAAVTGAVITYSPPKCPTVCQNYLLCHPSGLKSKDRCRIREVNEFIICPEGRTVASAKVKRISSDS